MMKILRQKQIWFNVWHEALYNELKSMKIENPDDDLDREISDRRSGKPKI